MSEVSEIKVEWTPNDSGRVSSIQIQSRIRGQYAGAEEGWTEQAAAHDPKAGSFTFASNAPGADVEVRARYRMTSGVYGAWFQDDIVTARVTVPYVDLTGTPSKLGDLGPVGDEQEKKLNGIAFGADVTRDNVAKDTANVGGRPSSTIITGIDNLRTDVDRALTAAQAQADKEIAAATPPSSVSNIKWSNVLTDAGADVTLTWTAATGATSYEVEISENGGGGIVFAAPSTSYRFAAKRNTTYAAKVRALKINVAGAWVSAADYETGRDTIAPAKPTVVSVEASYNTANIVWANGSEDDLSFAAIYLSDAAGNPIDTKRVAAAAGGGSVVWTNINKATTFRVSVELFDTSGNGSGASAPFVFSTAGGVAAADFTPDVSAIKTVTSLPATATDTQIVLLNGVLYRWYNGAWTKHVNGGDITTGTVTGAAIAPATLSEEKLVPNSITSKTIALGGVTGENIATKTIAGDKIVDATIGATQIMTGGVGTQQLASNSVVRDKIAEASIDASRLQSRAVTTDKIDLAAVTTDQIRNAAISTDKLVDASVVTDKIRNDAINADKILAGAVNESKIANGAVTETKITDDSISSPKIKANAITADKINAGAVTARALAIGNFDNIIPDGQMMDRSFWAESLGGGNVNFELEDQGGSWSFARRLRITPSNINNLTTRFFPIEIGATYKLTYSLWVSPEFNGWFRPVLHIPGIQWLALKTNAGSGLDSFADAWTASNGVTQRIDDRDIIFTVPSEANNSTRRTQFRFDGSWTAGYIEFMVKIVRVSDSTLIKDGAITTNKIVANAITGEKIQANAIDATKIQANSIDADKITTGAIIASKLGAQIGGGNKVRNSGFNNTVINAANGTIGAGFDCYNNAGGANEGAYWEVQASGRNGGNAQLVKWTSNTTTKGIILANNGPINNGNLLKPNSKFVLSFYAKGAGAALGNAFFPRFNVNPDVVEVVNPGATTEYQRYVYILYTKATVDNAIYITTNYYGPDAGYYYITDLQLEEGDVATAYAPALLSGEVTAPLIATNAIGETKIIDNAISTSKIQANAISADKIQANSIGTDKLQANSVNANKMAIGDFTNFAEDADFALGGSGWNLQTNSAAPQVLPAAAVGGIANTYRGSPYVGYITNGEGGFRNKAMMRVSPGDKLYGFIYGHLTNGTNNYAIVRISYCDINGAEKTVEQGASLPGIGNRPDVGGWQKSEVFGTVPANIAYARVECFASATNGEFFFGMAGLMRRSTGELIVDGAITATKIAAQAISADKIQTGAITIGANGQLGGAGTGQVTIGGLGYSGDLNATRGAPFGTVVGTTDAGTLDTRVAFGLMSSDTRNDNQPPSWYLERAYTTRVFNEFKFLGVVGVPNPAGDIGTYGQLTTTVPWSDLSGGPIHQEIRDQQGRYWNRYSTNTTTWSAWTDTGALVNAGTTTINGGKITTGSVTANQIAANTITGANVAANTISTKNLLIGDSYNYAENPTFSAGLVGFSEINNFLLSSNPGVAYKGNNSVYLVNNTGSLRNSALMKVAKGDQLLAFAYINQTGAGDPTYGMSYVRMSGVNADGAEIWTTGGQRVTGHTGTYQGYQRVIDIQTVPDSVVAVRVEVIAYKSSGEVFVGMVGLMRRMTGELIVDGAITAGKLAAGSITGDKIAANAITTNKIVAQTRPLSIIGMNMRVDADGVLRWNGGTASFQQSDGSFNTRDLAGGAYGWGGSRVWFYLYVADGAGNTNLDAQTGYNPPDLSNNPFYKLVASWNGGSDLTMHVGAGTSINGAQIVTGTITADRIQTGAITIGADGRLGGAGTGQVTIGGLGYNGALDATRGAPAGTNVGNTEAQTVANNAYTGARDPAQRINAYETTTINGGRITTGSITADQIAANTITGDKIVAGTISTAQLAADAITASKLAVGDADNIIGDSGYFDPVWWANGNDGRFSISTPGFPDFDRAVMIRPQGGIETLSKPFLIQPGAAYRVRVNIYMDTNFSGYFAPYVHVPGVLWYSVKSHIDGGEYYYRTPNQSVYADFVFDNTWGVRYSNIRFTGSWTGNVHFAISIVRISDTTLIKDGAITTNKIVANSINGDRITAGTLGADKIVAGTITTDRLSLGVQSKVLRNILNTGFWGSSWSDAAPGWSQNNAGANYWDVGSSPLGGSEPLLKMVATGNDSNGGWNVSISTADGFSSAKSYRYYTWVFAADGPGNSIYHGTDYVQAMQGGDAVNPYFFAFDKSSIARNKWYLMVGLVHPAGSGSGDSGISGLYDPVSGQRVIQGSDYRWRPGTTQATFRSYQFYGGVNGVAWFTKPVVEEVVAGQTPSIRSLFQNLDYAQNINVGSTQILPGMINISGGTTLASWRQGGDDTKIAGGAISANTIAANKLTIGNRNISVIGCDFEYNPANGQLMWRDGHILYTNDYGNPQSNYIPSGSIAWNGGSQNYIIWVKGEGRFIQTAPDAWEQAQNNNSNCIIMATWRGGTSFVANYGGTIINGDHITTGSVNADRIQAGTVLASSVIIGGVSGANTVADAFKRADYGNVSGAGKPETYTVMARGNQVSTLPANYAHGMRSASGGVFTDTLGSDLRSDNYGRSYTLMWRVNADYWAVRLYDVYGNSHPYTDDVGESGAQAMANRLASLANGTPVVIFTSDEPGQGRLSAGLPEQMYSCGASRSVFGATNWTGWDSYILIGTKGIGEGNGIERYKAGGSESFVSASFSIVNGVVQGSGKTLTSAKQLRFDDGRVVDELHTVQAGATVGAPAGTMIGNTEAQTVANNAAIGASDPAARINSYQTTTINGGRITTGSITADQIAANAIRVNNLVVGARAISSIGLVFEWNPANNWVSWSDGYLYYQNDDGSVRAQYVSSGNTGGANPHRFFYWIKDGGTIYHTQSEYEAFGTSDHVMLGSWWGGSNLNMTYGGTNINGNRITTGSITANQIAAGTISGDKIAANTITAAQLSTGQLITQSSQIGDATITNAKIANLSVDSLKIAGSAVGQRVVYITNTSISIAYS